MKLAARAARRVAAVTARLQRDVPLLLHAGVVLAPTLEQAQADVERHDDEKLARFAQMDEAGERMRLLAVSYRAQVAELVTPDKLVDLDIRRNFYPADHYYSADYWRTKARELGKDVS